MKVISNFTDTTIQTESITPHFENELSQQNVYVDLNDVDDQIDGMSLLKHINSQLDLLYKENKKRKYLLKEIAHYIIEK